MLHYSHIVLYAVLGFLCAIDSSVPEIQVRDHQQELYHHFQHLAYVADLVCREPQPRVVPVDVLLPSAVTWGKAYFPDVTVLHVCESSGSCSSGHRCGPSHVHSVHLPFKVTYLEDTEYHKKGSWAMEFHMLENHTQCACSEVARATATPPQLVTLVSQAPPNSPRITPELGDIVVQL